MTDRLPFYPLPELKDSITFLCGCTEALALSAKSHKELELLATAFFNDEGDAAQAMLQEIQQKRPDRNWIHDFWLDDYLNILKPLGYTSNFTVEFPLPALSAEMPRFAARLVRAVTAACLWFQKDAGPIVMDRGYYDRNQILDIFGTTRVPGRDRDNLVQKKSCYIAVYYRGNCYSLEVIKNGYPISLESLEENIHQIYRYNKTEKRNLHSLASYLPFSESRQIYQQIQQEAPEYCEAVKGALWNLVLLDDDPVTLQDKAYHILFGLKDQTNIKKSFNLFLTPSHKLYLNSEHSVADGLSHVMILEESLKRFMDKDGVSPGTLRYHPLPPLSGAKPGEAEKAFAVYEKACRRILFKAFTLDFPIQEWKGEGISADALLQFSLHYAYYQTFGEFKSAYESVSMANFQGGRTDGLRSLTVPSKAFILDMVKNSRVDFNKLKAASDFHKQMIKTSKSGLNYLRHIYALQKISSHPMFEHPLVKELFTDTISTSTLGKTVKVFFFAPVTPEGIGIAYFLDSACIHLNISYYADFPIETYLENLREYWDELAVCLGQIKD